MRIHSRVKFIIVILKERLSQCSSSTNEKKDKYLQCHVNMLFLRQTHVYLLNIHDIWKYIFVTQKIFMKKKKSKV